LDKVYHHLYDGDFSIYIHIPFCRSRCSYCDFHFITSNSQKFIKKHIDYLIKDYNNYQIKRVSTAYIGGGTPSLLSYQNLKYLLSSLNIKPKYEFSFEFNIEDINIASLDLLKEYNIDRLSIGIQSFNDNLLKILNRRANYNKIKENIKLLKEYNFELSIDLIIGIPTQTLKDLEKDIKEFIALDINHISIYELSYEYKANITKLYPKNKRLDNDTTYKFFSYIDKELNKNGYKNYEISNYCKNNKYSKHNKNYWNMSHYIGIGAGASGFIKTKINDEMVEIRTKNYNLFAYQKALKDNNNYQNIDIIDKKEWIKNYLITGLRTKWGIDHKKVIERSNINLNDLPIIKHFQNERYFKKSNNLILKKKKLFLQDSFILEILNEIDKLDI